MLTRIVKINKVWRLRQNQAFKMIRIHQIKTPIILHWHSYCWLRHIYFWKSQFHEMFCYIFIDNIMVKLLLNITKFRNSGRSIGNI